MVKDEKMVRFELILIVIMISLTIFLGIGYSALNQVLTVKSSVISKRVDGIKIKNITLEDYKNATSEDLENEDDIIAMKFKFKDEEGQEDDPRALVYKVTIQNTTSTSIDLETITLQNTYNLDIQYQKCPSLTNECTENEENAITLSESIDPKSEKVTYIVIKDVDKTVTEDEEIEITIKFNLDDSPIPTPTPTPEPEINYLKLNAFDEIGKENISYILFVEEIDETATERWDLSEKENGSIIAWQDGVFRGKKIIKIASTDGVIYANPNSSNLFKDMNVDISDIQYFDTSHVTNMESMFENITIEVIHAEYFDTSKVTNMRNMFKNANVTRIQMSDKFIIGDETDTSQMFVDVYDAIKIEATQELINKIKSMPPEDKNNFDDSNFVSIA